MTRATCHICGKPADGLIDISRSRGGRRDISNERIYLCSDHLDCKVTIDSGRPLTTLEAIEATYYGVWSGEEWWLVLGEVFHTKVIGVARAQAASAKAAWNKAGCGKRWKVRKIGEDGLPVDAAKSEAKPEPLTEEQKQIRSEAAAHKCVICDNVGTSWVEMRDREWHFCDRHEAWGQYVLSDHVRRNPKVLDTADPPPRPESCAMCGEPA